MRILVALSLLCVSTCSVSASVCSDAGNECRESCDGFGTQIFTFGNFGCISTPGLLCCKASETTTALPTTTPEPTTTTETTTTGPPTTTEEPTTTTLPPAQQCGISNSAVITGRIYNAENTQACDWPWLVSIRGKTSPTDTFLDAKPVCTGVLIDTKWVLTTAYCASSAALFGAGTSRQDNVFVVAGEYDVTADDYTGNCDTAEKIAGVSQILIHPGYVPPDVNLFSLSDLGNTANTGNNLALLELSKNFTFSNCVRQVCLPSNQARRKRQAECPALTKECWTASSGTKLQETAVTLISQDAWNVHSMLKGSTYTPKPLTSHGVFKNEAVRACNEDNGGMVVCKKTGDTQWTIEGLINRPGFISTDCTESTDNHVLITDVGDASMWIHERIMP